MFYWGVHLGGNVKHVSSVGLNKKEVMTQVRAIDSNSKCVQVGESLPTSFKLGSQLKFENAASTQRDVSVQTFVLETSCKKVQCDLQEMTGASSSLTVEFQVENSENEKRDVLLSVNITQEEEKPTSEVTTESVSEEYCCTCHYCGQNLQQEVDVVKHYLRQQCTKRFQFLDVRDINATICLR